MLQSTNAIIRLLIVKHANLFCIDKVQHLIPFQMTRKEFPYTWTLRFNGIGKEAFLAMNASEMEHVKRVAPFQYARGGYLSIPSGDAQFLD